MRRALLAPVMFWLLVALAAPTHAQTATSGSGSAAQASDTSPFRVEGAFDLGFRWRDTNGNEDKYFEDLNYRTGPRLFNVDLSLAPTQEGPFDVLSVNADSLGDPFQAFGVTLRKFGQFSFRFRRNESAYFYRDILLPPDLASIEGSTGGDFHTFNLHRTNDRIDFDVDLGRRAELFVKFNRQARLGESTTTLDVSRDEFELDRPVDETKNDYTVGFTLRFDTVSLYFDETIRDYEGGGRTFLPGASLGENPDDLTELFFFEQLLPYDFTMPQSTVRVNVRPDPRLTLNVGFVASSLDGEFTEQEIARGISFLGLPLDTVESGRGQLDRTMQLTDVDVTYDLNDRVALLGGVRVSRLDQEGRLVRAGLQEDTRVEIASNIVEVGAQVYPTEVVTLTGGYRYESRNTTFDPRASEVDTEQNSLFVTGVVAPSPMLNILAEYERGNYDNPFTLVAPTSLDRVKARVRLRPTEGLALIGTFLARRLANDLAGSVHPTAPRLGDPATLDTTDLTLRATYERRPVSVFGSYTRRDITNEVVNQVVTSPGFLGGLVFELPAIYESDLNRSGGGVRFTVSDTVALGTELHAYRNRGSFGLDWEQYQVFGELLSPAGYLLRLTYQYNSLDEESFDFDDYSSHIMTASVGYRF